MTKLFFSYSHKDEALRDELEIHLSTIKRQGVIETWHDRRIGGGNEFGKAIDENLEQSEVILLLVSPYFIASDYCYDVEMQRAIQKHEDGTAKVIPVILHPCDWRSTPFGRLLATPKDGKPISRYPPNYHDAFLEVVNVVKQAVREINPESHGDSSHPVKTTPVALKNLSQPRSSNLRLKKEFSEREKDDFLEESFEYMANFFEISLEGLNKRNSSIITNFRKIDANHFTSVVYKNDKSVSQCKISFGGSLGGISFSSSISSNDNSFNESMSVAEDGYTLSLKPMGMSQIMRGNSESGLTQQGASELYWSLLIEYLQ